MEPRRFLPETKPARGSHQRLQKGARGSSELRTRERNVEEIDGVICVICGWLSSVKIKHVNFIIAVAVALECEL